jgi:hypothetical protein
MRKRSKLEEINEAKLAQLWPGGWLMYRAWDYSRDPDRVTDNASIKPLGLPETLATAIPKCEIPTPKLDFQMTFKKGAK